MLRRLTALLFATALLVPLGAGPAGADQAVVYEQGRYDDPYSFTDTGCGFTINVQGRARGHFRTTVVPGSDGQAFFAHDHYRFTDHLTNPANGRTATISGHGYFREVAARHLQGDVWEFTSVETGTPFKVRDGDGKLVLMDRGKIVRRQGFDTLGDSQPGGEPVGDEEILRINGKFPSYAEDFDFCAMLTDLVG